MAAVPCKKTRVLLIGGLPRPSGGVTVFLGRMVNRIGNRIDFSVLDINPGEKEPTLAISHRIAPTSRYGRLLWTYLNSLIYRGDVIHFNYSRVNALLVALSLPKFGRKIYLTMHNGALLPEYHKTSGLRRWLLLHAARRVDRFFVLCDDHMQLMEELGVSKDRIVRAKSHIPPPNVKATFVDEEHRALRAQFSKVVVASGHVDQSYRYEYIVNYVNDHPDTAALFFVYGRYMDMDYLEEVKNRALNSAQVRFFFSQSEATFLGALTISDAFLRPNSVDSWGISIADACMLGVPAIASDVCERYPGTILFQDGDYDGFCQAVEQVLEGRHKGAQAGRSNGMESMEQLYLDTYRSHGT